MKRLSKRILSVLLCLSMLLALVPVGVQAAGATMSVRVTPSTTVAQVGDTVEFVVTATGSGVTAMQFELDIPEEMTYVAGSATVPSGLKSYLGWAATDWTEDLMMWTGYNDLPATFGTDTVILTFSCTVEAEGNYEIGLYDLLPFDENYEEFTPQLNVGKVTVSGQQAPTVPTVPTVPDGPFFNVTVVPSVNEAEIGDTVDYTVYAYGDGITALQFELIIPEGMTFVKGSGAVPSGLKDYLGWAATAWTESSMMWTGYNDLPASFGKDTVIMTFSCTVEAAGTHEVELFELLPFDENYEELSPTLSVGTVTVEGAQPCAHSFTNYVFNGDATCTKNGTETAVCDNGCGETDTREVTDSFTGHYLKRVNATVTCTQAGHIAYYVCDNCGGMFADATASIPVSAEDVKISALGHIDEDGDKICDRCDYVIKPITSDEPAVPEDAFFNVTVVPSVSEAKIGDTIDYTVYAHGAGITALQFNLIIPEGLSYVAGSAAIPSGLKEYLGWEATDWTEEVMLWTGYNVLSSVFEEGTVILTFSCIAEAEGTHEVELFELLPFDEYYEEFEANLTVGLVNVSGGPVEEIPTTLPEGAFMDITVKASKTEAKVGDTIDYTVYAFGNEVTALQFNLIIPEGLSYVAGSASIPAGLKSYLGWSATDWTESGMMWTGYNDLGSLFEDGTVILTFSCVADIAGTYEIELFELLPFDENYEEFEAGLTVDQVNVSGEIAPTQYTRVYCQAPSTWTSCKAYWWGSAISTNPSWPGVAMDQDGNGIWFYDVPSDVSGLIFTNGSGTQTSDLQVPTDDKNMYVFQNRQWVEYADGPVVIVQECYVAGQAGLCGVDWDPSAAANQMFDNDKDGVYTLTYCGVAAGTYEFKVTDGTWNKSWGQDGGIQNYVLTVPEDNSTVEIRFDSRTYLIETTCIPPVPSGTFMNITVVPSVTYAQVGDTVDYTVYAHGEGITALQFELRIPDGLTYVAYSGAVPSGLKDYLGWAATDWTESSMKWTGYNDEPSVFEKDTVIMTFSCVVKAEGTYEVELFELLPFDEDYEEIVPQLNVGKVTVSNGSFMNVTVVPSVSQALVGDTVDYTVYAYGDGITALQFELIIPEGMTFVKGSGAVPSGLKSYLGWAATDWTESSMRWTGYNDQGSLFEDGTVILTFSCIVEAEGTYEVELFELLPFDEDYNEFAPGLNVGKVTAVYSCASNGHSFGSYVFDNNATCTANGTETATCAVCGVTDTREVQNTVKPHSYRDVVKAPTCTAEGYTTSTCTVCAHSYKHSYVAALGHSFQNGKCTVCGEYSEPFADFNVVAAMKNCNTVEYTVYAHGENITALQFNLVVPDGMTYVADSAAVPSGLKDYLGWAATDWTESSMMWTGYNDVPSVFEEGTVILTFTCTMDEPGYYQVELRDLMAFDPNYCDFECTLSVDTASPGSHSFTNYISNGDATCTADGTKTAKCDYCNETDTVVDAHSALGHSFTKYISNGDATCTANGTETAKCVRCDVTDTRVEDDSALGHSFTKYVSNGDADCYNDGTKTAKCDRCAKRDTVVDENTALGHSFTKYVSNGDADCLNDGTKTAKCDRCVKRNTVIDENTALGHSFTKYVSNGDADCYNDGTMTAKCDRCNRSHTVIEVGTGKHQMHYSSNNDATCTEDGTLTGTCSVCGYTEIVAAPGTATGHSFTKYVSNGDATCMADGTKTAKCDDCDATDTMIDFGSAAHAYANGFCVFCGELGQSNAVLKGTLTLAKDGDTQLTLSANGKVLTTVNVQNGEYTMDVWAGEFVLTVTKDGCATREYAVTLTEGENVLDLKLNQNGDINGDGKINAGDVARIYAHIKKTNLLADDYQLLCADYTGDGRLNVGDTSKIYALVKKR